MSNNDRVKYTDPETGRTKIGRIVVKPGREQEAENLRAMGAIAAQAGYERYLESMQGD